MLTGTVRRMAGLTGRRKWGSRNCLRRGLCLGKFIMFDGIDVIIDEFARRRVCFSSVHTVDRK